MSFLRGSSVWRGTVPPIGTVGNGLALEAAGNRELAGLGAPLPSDRSVLPTPLKAPHNLFEAQDAGIHLLIHSFIHIHLFSQSSCPCDDSGNETPTESKSLNKTRSSLSATELWCGRDINNVAERNTSNIYSVLAVYQPKCYMTSALNASI